MEVNKGEAERCRDLALKALQQGQSDRAIRLFKKSLALYPLPGVEALLTQAERRAATTTSSNGDTPEPANTTSSSSNSSSGRPSRPTPQRAESTASTATESSAGVSGGRSYTAQQVEIVETVLKAKEGGRGAHYRVLGVSQNASDADLKKAYRKLALKLHPDKNSAPRADDAFKAVGLAYGTLSDPQKRTIYDRYGEEDPDNRGGGMRPGNMHFRGGRGQEVSPEEIFNMFFGGGMQGGGMHMRGGPGGMHFYSNFGGPGGFRAQQFGQRARAQQPGGRQGQEPEPSLWQNIAQLLPFIVIMVLSFLNMTDTGSNMTSSYSSGEGRYFSLTQKDPFLHELHTQLTKVKEIPYYVTNKFMRTYHRDRYQLSQVERMVENAYEQFLVNECNSQRSYKKSLIAEAEKKPTPEEQERAKMIATKFELSRCVELNDLYPLRHSGKKKR